MTRSADPRKKLPSQRGAKRTGAIGTILPGDHTEVARDIQRLWFEITRRRDSKGGGGFEWDDVGLGCRPSVHVPFFDVVMAIAETTGLRGYWRLGDSAPYVDSKPALPDPITGSTWANTPMTVASGAPWNGAAMSDLAVGALPSTDDDGAVIFNASDGKGNYLSTPNTWGTGTTNPFEWNIPAVTVAGWAKPKASSSTFDGGVFSHLSIDSGYALNGYSLGVTWPSRSAFFQVNSARLTSSVLDADEWVFMVGVADTISTRLYLDGALVATGPARTWYGNNTPGQIGIWNYSAGTGSTIGSNAFGVFYGAIDEVVVFGGALTDSQIGDLYFAGAP